MMTQDLHTLTGPYALDALPAEEAATFEEHLVGCASCRAEVAEFRATAAKLADATATAPPADMKSAVMAQIAATRQDTPRVVGIGQPPKRRLRRLVLSAAAAVAVIAVGLAFALGSLMGRVNDLEHQQRTLAAVLASADVTVAHGTGAGGAAASIVASGSRGEAVVSFANLSGAPTGHVYALWMIGPNGPIPAGLFDADAEGRAVAVMRGDVAGMLSMAVTVEPAGGSDRPTTVPLLNVPVAG